MPESDIVLVQMDSIPSESGAMISNAKNADEHYTYINLDQVYWDKARGYWRPKGTVGDRYKSISYYDHFVQLLNAYNDQVMFLSFSSFKELQFRVLMMEI